MIVETDGDQHDLSDHDRVRDDYLVELGFVVVRFWNEEMAWHPEWVVDQVRAVLRGQVVDPEVRLRR